MNYSILITFGQKITRKKIEKRDKDNIVLKKKLGCMREFCNVGKKGDMEFL